MSTKSKTIERRLEDLEKWVTAYKPIIAALAKEYELQQPRVNPAKYCKDTIDKEIINYLLDNTAAGTTEIALALQSKYPELNRHTVGKRILRIQKQAETEGWHILYFEAAYKQIPESEEKKYRAWWIDIKECDLTAFKKEMDKPEEKQNGPHTTTNP